MKAYYNNFASYGTRIHTFEFHPSNFRLTLTEGIRGTKQRLPDIRHNWLENNGFERLGSINAQFFGTHTVGLQYVDSGFTTVHNTIDDQFLELIFQDNKLIIDNIVAQDIPVKYPKTNWAAGVGFALVIDGKLDLKHANKFSHATSRHPRTAIGQKADGNIILLATDGRGTGSAGLTGEQLAKVMLDLKCVTAISLDGGGSSQMAIKQDSFKVINALDGNWQRPITSALVVYGKGGEVVDMTRQATVEVRNDRNFSVLYSHFDEIYVSEGQLVTPKLTWADATKIGKMGNTGISTGAHLHIGVVEGINPSLWRLSDMAFNNPRPSRQQTDFFIDNTLFETDILVTTDWLGYNNHFAYDVVPRNRHTTQANFDVMWNRSFAGRVIKTGFDRAYGNYVIIWYNIL